MGREVRRVPADWVHPEDKPLHDFRYYVGDLEEAKRSGDPIPSKSDYMPDWPESKKTHLQMYETTSEGTPISPVMETPEELARWLTDNKASAFGNMTATYEQWLSTIKRGFAVSAVGVGSDLMSGVAGMHKNE
jgi:hypothetical protein